MSRFVSSALLGLLVLTATPFAQNDVSGAWDLTINAPNGAINAGATLKQDGDKLSGTLSSPQGDVEMSGTIKGSTLSLAFTVNGPQGTMNVTMTGETDGGTMTGMMDFGMGTADFTGKKK